VYKDVNPFAGEQFRKCRFHPRWVGYVANVHRRLPLISRDLLPGTFCGCVVDIHNANRRAVFGKLECDGLPDAAARAGDYGYLSVQPKIAIHVPVTAQRDTPRFQGMKSSCCFSSAFVRSSPLATFTTESRIVPPICSMVCSPSIIGPVSISMMSCMRWARLPFVESFTTGVMGFPVGVPRPVVNKTMLAPAPTCAVTHSTSFPGVHWRFSPGSREYSG